MKRKNKLMSIIIVNWNGVKWLDKCISSLLQQTYKNIEIIVVDNASTDNSVNFLKNHFPNIKVIKNKKNIGFAGGNNAGIKNCKGEYVLLLNNDTWIEKDFIKALFKFYENNDYDIVAPTERRYDKSQNFNCNTTIDPLGSPMYFYPRYKKNKTFYLCGVCLFFLKDVYFTTRGLDSKFFMYFEDVDWFWRMSLLGKKFGYADKIYVYHAGAGSSGKGIKYNVFLWRNENILQTLLKNYSTLTLCFILPLYLLQNLFEIIFFAFQLKFDIAYSYIKGWGFNIKNFSKILKKRRWVQKNRVINDWEIIKKMYWGPAKLKTLVNYK